MLGTRSKSPSPQTNRKTPWFCERIACLAQTKRKALIQFKSLSTPDSYNMYKVIRNVVNTKIRQVKRDFWESQTKNMERDFYGQQKSVWRMIQNQKRETQGYININNTIDKKKWVDYFTSLYAREMEKPRIICEDNNPVEVNEREKIEVIQKLKDRKSPSEDGIINEMIKNGGPTLWKEITVLVKQNIQVLKNTRREENHHHYSNLQEGSKRKSWKP